MNTGVQDSFNLGWKLALVIKGVSSPSLLESFNEERVPVVTQMLNITSDLLKKTISNEQSGWNRSGPVKQLGVNYRWSFNCYRRREANPGEARKQGISVR